MEQTIKITIPKDKIAKYNEKTQTIQFFDKEPIRSKSWEEFCKNNPNIDGEYLIDTCSVIREIDASTANRINFNYNYLASKEDAKGILALIQLTRLHDEWVGDWNLIKNTGYYAITYNLPEEQLIINQWWNTLHILSFPTKGMAEEFLEYFRELIWKAKRFI